MGLKAYVGAVTGLAGLVMLAAGFWSAGGQLPVHTVLFAAAFAVVQLLPVPIPRGGQIELVRFEEALIVPMVLALSPIDALVAVAAGVLAGHLVSRAQPLKAVFNAAQMVLSAAACLVVVDATVGQRPGSGTHAIVAALFGLVAMFVVNQLLVTGVMQRAGAGAFRALLLDDAALKGLMWTANASLGLMLILPLFHAPWLLAAMLVPLVVLHLSYRAYLDQSHEEERLRTLNQHAQELSEDLAFDRTALLLVESARRLSGGAVARLSVDGEQSSYVADQDGTRVADVHETETSRGHVQLAVPLAGRTGFRAHLTVEHPRPSGPVQSLFSARDRTLLEMLARHAEAALDNALLFSRVTAERRKFAQIFDHSAEGLLVLSSSGRVLSWNRAMETISGFAATDVTDSPIALIAPPLAEIPRSRAAATITANMTTSDGGRRNVRASFAPIPSEDDADGAWVVVVHDITAERENERLKDDFVATVSHELRTPLTAIKGFLETMRRDDVSFEPGQIAMFLDIMSEQAERLERLIADLLDASIIESGRDLKVDVQDVDVSAEAARATQAFLSARPEADVRTSFDDAQDGLLARADRHRLHQVLTNLLENACKHAPSDAPIRLDVSTSELGVDVEVADSGRGIAAADLPHIFDRFYLTADSVTRNGGGAGLGLFISKRIMDAMGGTIDVRSTLGAGTTFRLHLPLSTATADAAGEPGGSLVSLDSHRNHA